MNQTVLIGKIENIDGSTVSLLVDNTLTFNITMPKHYISSITKYKKEDILLGVKGRLDFNKNNQLKIVADKIAIIEQSKEQSVSHKDMCR